MLRMADAARILMPTRPTVQVNGGPMTDTATPNPEETRGAALELGDLKEREVVAPPKADPLSAKDLASVASAQLNRRVELQSDAALTLSARHPFDDAGLMDFFRPGRWDTTIDLVFMTSDFGGEPSAGYAQFTASDTGSYLVAVRISGHQTTLKVGGPWGTVSAFSATTSDHPVATALWDGKEGDTLFFSFSFTGGIIGYIESIEVRQLR